MKIIFLDIRALKDQVDSLIFSEYYKNNEMSNIGRQLIDINTIYLYPIGVQYLTDGNKVKKVTKPENQLGHLENEKAYTFLSNLTNKEIFYLNGYKAKRMKSGNKVYASLKIPEESFIFCGSAYFLFSNKYGHINLKGEMTYTKFYLLRFTEMM